MSEEDSHYEMATSQHLSQEISPPTVPPVASVQFCRGLLNEAEQTRARFLMIPNHPVIPAAPALTTWDALDPLRTVRQRMMSKYYTCFGVIGLAYYITQIVKWEMENHGSPNRSPRNMTPSRSWNLIVDDWEDNRGELLLYYLSSLHPDLIKALIAGDLPRRMQELSFSNRIEPLIRLRDTQGCYVVYVAQESSVATSSQAAAQSALGVGNGFTPEQLRSIHGSMAMYINVSHPLSRYLAKMVDDIGSHGRDAGLDYAFERRYGSGHAHFDVHQKWLDFVQDHYIDRINHIETTGERDLIDQPLTRCFPYVGLSSSVLARSPAYWHHGSNSSALLGLFTATAAHLFPSVFGTHKFTWQIFRTVHRQHIGFDEKLLTILNSAYPWDGGLCLSFAGLNPGNGRSDLSSAQTQRLDANYRDAQVTGLGRRNLAESRDQCNLFNDLTEAMHDVDAVTLHQDMIHSSIDVLQACRAAVEDAELRLELIQADLLQMTTDCEILEDALAEIREEEMTDQEAGTTR